MNKTELVVSIAEKAAISKKDAEKALSAFLDTVVDELKKGEKVQLVGFGTFEVSIRAPSRPLKFPLPRTRYSRQARLLRILFQNNLILKTGAVALRTIGTNMPPSSEGA